METESHFYSIILKSVIKTFMIAILQEFFGHSDCRHNFEEGNDRQVREIMYFFSIFELKSTLCIVEVIAFIEFPYEEESISNVFVGLSKKGVNSGMGDFSNFIHEEHDSSLEYFCCISEVTYITETEDSHDFFTSKHRINFSTLLHIRGDDF